MDQLTEEEINIYKSSLKKRGRPPKYFTEEERIKAKHMACLNYYNNNKEKKRIANKEYYIKNKVLKIKNIIKNLNEEGQ